MTTPILILLILSALGELGGTLTVALSYARGHRLAQNLIRLAGPSIRSTNVAEQLELNDSLLRTWDTESDISHLRRAVGDQLVARWWLTAGLVAYGVGALTGLTAGLIALYR